MKGFRLGDMPLTLFILIAAAVLYLRLSARRPDATPGRLERHSDASRRPTVTIPTPPSGGRIFSPGEATEWLRQRGVEGNLFGSFTERQLEEYLKDTRTDR